MNFTVFLCLFSFLSSSFTLNGANRKRPAEEDLVGQLKDLRFNPNTQDEKGNTQLHCVLYAELERIKQSRQAAGGWKYGRLLFVPQPALPLHEEHAPHSLFNRVQRLLAQGASPSIKNLEQRSPLGLAYDLKRQDLIDLLTGATRREGLARQAAHARARHGAIAME